MTSQGLRVCFRWGSKARLTASSGVFAVAGSPSARQIPTRPVMGMKIDAWAPPFRNRWTSSTAPVRVSTGRATAPCCAAAVVIAVTVRSCIGRRRLMLTLATVRGGPLKVDQGAREVRGSSNRCHGVSRLNRKGRTGRPEVVMRECRGCFAGFEAQRDIGGLGMAFCSV
jgi:hypothetical protein